MNKKLPYEDAFEKQMKNLQASNEDQSWQKMKHLLDNKDKKPPYAFYVRFVALSVAILLLLIGVSYVVYTHHPTNENAAILSKTNPLPTNAAHKNNVAQNPPVVSNNDRIDSFIKKATAQDAHSFRQSNTAIKQNGAHTPVTENVTVQKGEQNTWKKLMNHKRSSLPAYTNNHHSAQKEPAKAKASTDLPSQTKEAMQSTPAPQDLSSGLQKSIGQSDSIEAIADRDKLSPQPAATDIALAKETTLPQNLSSNQKISPLHNKKFFVSAGFGMQQQLPIAGQKVVYYGYNGSNSIVSDYIPSIYFRLEKEHSWFVQAAYTYAAPQLVKETAYSRHTQANNFSGTLTTTTLRIRKTFYSEIPLSFNYFIHGNLSAGAGIVYSSFHGAIAEKEIATKSAQAQSLTKQIIPISGYTDSFLYRSHTYFQLAADYKWRRLSLGLRYAKDLQSYIKYTLPDGSVRSQKNSSLTFILRFRLWNSAKF